MGMPAKPDISFQKHPDGDIWMSAKFSNEFEMSVARGSQLAMITTIVEAITTRYVEERFADIVAKIDENAIVAAVVEEIKKRVVNAMGIVETPEEKRKKEDLRILALQTGVCPECKANFKTNRDWGIFPALNPEKAEYLREHNINLGTGHKNDCPLNGAR